MPLNDDEIRMRLIEVMAPVWATVQVEQFPTPQQWRDALEWCDMLASYVKDGSKPGVG
jgi:hypothetical protein